MPLPVVTSLPLPTFYGEVKYHYDKLTEKKPKTGM
jgi:hypothetical protein